MLVNISNESWFPDRELDQHLAMAKFRAVETGASLVRATNTGISCVISPQGVVTDRLEVEGRSKGVRGRLVSTLPMPDAGVTLYVRWGEVLPIVSLVLAVAGLAATLRGRRAPTEPSIEKPPPKRRLLP